MAHEVSKEVSEVSLDSVGSAEDVLRRLIHERKSLEDAVRVLETYRLVKVDIINTEKELNEIDDKLKAGKVELDNLSVKFNKEKKEVDDKVREYKIDKGKEMDIALNKMNKAIGIVDTELTVQRDRLNSMVSEYEGKMKVYEGKIKEAQDTLDILKVEHVSLIETFEKASRYFKADSPILQVK